MDLREALFSVNRSAYQSKKIFLGSLTLISSQRHTGGDVSMSTSESALYREAIRRTLANRVGDAPANAGAIAEATLKTWHQMSARLSPVIGAEGVDVLLDRSLHLTNTVYPWLAIAVYERERATLLASIRKHLADRETDVAAEAGQTLLVNFVELLSTLIGESLTERLLGPVWASPSSVSEQEKSS